MSLEAVQGDAWFTGEKVEAGDVLEEMGRRKRQIEAVELKRRQVRRRGEKVTSVCVHEVCCVLCTLYSNNVSLSSFFLRVPFCTPLYPPVNSSYAPLCSSPFSLRNVRTTRRRRGRTGRRTAARCVRRPVRSTPSPTCRYEYQLNILQYIYNSLHMFSPIFQSTFQCESSV